MKRGGAGGRPEGMRKRVNIVSVKLVREASKYYATRRINSPEDVSEIAGEFLKDADREILLVVCLNTKNEPTAIHAAAVGTLNNIDIHPREIFKAAILANSDKIILVHNHPSGDPNPSKSDMEITKRLKQVGEIIGIPVLDHVIIGNGKLASLRALGVI